MVANNTTVNIHTLQSTNSSDNGRQCEEGTILVRTTVQSTEPLSHLFVYGATFNSREVRAKFVSDVFKIVAVMIFIVTAMIAFPFANAGVGKWLASPENFWFFIVTACVYLCVFVFVYILVICCKCGRKQPCNFLLLLIFTVATGLYLMALAAHFELVSVLLCAIVTFVSCVGVIAFSICTKRDLTSYYGLAYLFGLILCNFLFMMLLMVLVFHSRVLYAFYAAFAAMLCMVYMAIDIQLIMGGGKYEISTKDHVYAALILFTNIIQFFAMILTGFGRWRSSS